MHTSCRHLITLLIAFVSLFWASASHALTPQSRWWWNEAESGRGFSIELQNNTIFMSGFLYDAGGAPLWFVASGPYSQTANSFEGDMLSLRGGQCISCSYRELDADALRQLESKLSAVAKQSNPDVAVFTRLATPIKAAH